jgi:hypothetical protein
MKEKELITRWLAYWHNLCSKYGSGPSKMGRPAPCGQESAIRRVFMLERIGIVAAAFAVSACWASTASAGVVYSNDFSTNDTGFGGSSALTTSPSGNQFLYFGGGGGSGTLTLSGLASHSDVALSFDLYVVGSMDGNGYGGAPIYGGGPGDYFTVDYNGNAGGTLFSQAFANYGGGETQSYPIDPSAPGTGAYAINGLGYTGFPSTNGIQDAEYAITLSPIADSSGTIAFNFYDNSNEGAGNEFYGIDNVSVSTSGVAAVPEPGTWAMMLVGMGAIGFAMRRRPKVSVSYA